MRRLAAFRRPRKSNSSALLETVNRVYCGCDLVKANRESPPAHVLILICRDLWVSRANAQTKKSRALTAGRDTAPQVTMSKRSREESTSDADHASVISSAQSSNNGSESAHTPKYTSMEPTKRGETAMRCVLPPHKTLKFASVSEYETHYQKEHSNRCVECQRNFPTAHFLDLHIAENHDPLVAALRERREKTYGCFVEGCEKKCSAWQKRKRHLVDKHGFPRNYDFFIVNSGIDGRRSMLRRGIDAQGHRKSSRERKNSLGAESSESHEAPSMRSDTEIVEQSGKHRVDHAAKSSTAASGVDDITNSMSSLNMVPRSVSFGKRKGRFGFSKS